MAGDGRVLRLNRPQFRRLLAGERSVEGADLVAEAREQPHRGARRIAVVRPHSVGEQRRLDRKAALHPPATHHRYRITATASGPEQSLSVHPCQPTVARLRRRAHRGLQRPIPDQPFLTRQRVRQPLRLGEGHTHLDAVRGGDIALGLDLLPRCVEPLGPDEREDVRLTAVLPYERRGQPETPTGLEIRRELEDGRRQQVDLVVDDEAPVLRVKDGEVRELLQLVLVALWLVLFAAFAPGQDLIRRDGDRRHALVFAGVFGDVFFFEVSLVQDLPSPLPTPDDGVWDLSVPESAPVAEFAPLTDPAAPQDQAAAPNDAEQQVGLAIPYSTEPPVGPEAPDWLDAPPPVQTYEPGTWGPADAEKLTAPQGGWHGPWIV